MILHDYLGNFCQEKILRKTVNLAVRALKRENFLEEFDSIAVMGHSGLLVGGPLSIKLKKDLLIVRKVKKGSHAFTYYEGVYPEDGRVLILDDFAQSGKTIVNICKRLEELDLDYDLAGIYFYNDKIGWIDNDWKYVKKKHGDKFPSVPIITSKDISFYE